MNETSIPLVETKLHAPRRRGGVVARPRLRDRLDRREQPALTLVSAPAGFGKTTLVAELVRRRTRRRRGCRSIARDNDPALFWTYVVAALQTAAPDAGDDGAGAPRRRRSRRWTPSSPRCSTTCTPSPTTWCWCSTTTTSSSRRRSTRRWPSCVEHLPPHVHLVHRQSGRSAAAAGAPAGPRRAARDPRRRPALHRRRGRRLPQRGDGPGAGRRRTSTRSRPAPRAGSPPCSSPRSRCRAATTSPASSPSFAGDDRFVVDYLVGEVLERQTDEVRSFLLETSVLEPAHRAALRRRHRRHRRAGPCSSSSTGRTCSSSRSTIGAPGTATTTSSPTCSGPGCSTSDPSRVPELHRRASDWYEANGDRPEAIEPRHGRRATSSGPRELIELAAPADAPDPPGGDAAALARSAARRALPRPAGARPSTWSGARMATGDPTGVEPLLAARRVAARPRPTRRRSCSTTTSSPSSPRRSRCTAPRWRSSPATSTATIAHANRALELAEPTDHLRRGSAAALLGLAHWTDRRPRARRERRYAEAVAQLHRRRLPPRRARRARSALADIQIAQGRLGDATRTFEAGLRLHGRSTPGCAARPTCTSG